MSGLVALKELLDKGHDVTCFEKESREGGVFNFPAGVAYDAMQLTVSQHFMCFTSLPAPPREKRELWTRSRYSQYLHEFAETFDLFRHIHFGTDVTGIEGCSSGQVRVTGRRGADTFARTFDAVALCQGAFRADAPRLPSIEGLESFPGRVVHSGSYKDPEPFRGLRVLCVGMGETGADITQQISEVAASLHAQHAELSGNHQAIPRSRPQNHRRRLDAALSLVIAGAARRVLRLQTAVPDCAAAQRARAVDLRVESPIRRPARLAEERRLRGPHHRWPDSGACPGGACAHRGQPGHLRRSVNGGGGRHRVLHGVPGKLHTPPLDQRRRDSRCSPVVQACLPRGPGEARGVLRVGTTAAGRASNPVRTAGQVLRAAVQRRAGVAGTRRDAARDRRGLRA